MTKSDALSSTPGSLDQWIAQFRGSSSVDASTRLRFAQPTSSNATLGRSALRVAGRR